MDIKDWDFDEVRKNLNNICEYSVTNMDAHTYVEDFLDKVEKHIKGQQKQVAALFKPKE